MIFCTGQAIWDGGVYILYYKKGEVENVFNQIKGEQNFHQLWEASFWDTCQKKKKKTFDEMFKREMTATFYSLIKTGWNGFLRDKSEIMLKMIWWKIIVSKFKTRFWPNLHTTMICEKGIRSGGWRKS